MKRLVKHLTIAVLLMTAGFVSANDEGKEQYVKNCLMCHGEKGHGDGPAGKALNAANIYEELVEHKDDEAHLIEEVMEGEGAMPAWKGRLSEDQVKAIFAYIQSVQ